MLSRPRLSGCRSRSGNVTEKAALAFLRWQEGVGSTGVFHKDRGTVAEKRRQMKEELPKKTTSSPRTREASSPFLLGSQQAASDQLKEDAGGGLEESDSPILLRDGRAVHMGKGRAEGHRGHRTDARGRNAPTRSVSSALSALTRKAEREPKHRFRSLYRLIDLQMLYESFGRLKRGAAPGLDGLTVEAYEENLDENLRSLLERLKCKRYRAQAVKRRYIPKSGGKLRPLGIPSLEDKIVQHAASRILESIWESEFSDRSVGYRRGGPGGREASCQLARELDDGKHRWVVEADIRSFFEDVDHEWLTRMLEQRIDDRAFIGLIRKWLKAGVLEPGASEPEDREAGTPQGGVISPVLANIYLHYVLDLWIEKRVRKQSQSSVLFMRYADDLVVCFGRKGDADNYLRHLRSRLAKFSLSLAEEKTSLVTEACHGASSDQQEEVSRGAAQDEGLDPQSAELAVEDDPQQSAQALAWVLELLWGDRQQFVDLALSFGGKDACLQVVEPPESA